LIRVTKICRSDYHRGGGGAIVMYRLHNELRKAGVDSKIFCSQKTVDSPYTMEIPFSKVQRFIEFRLKKISEWFGLNDIHAIRSFGIKKNKFFYESDVIHFHGIHGDFFSYLALPLLTASKPAVFTLHDMWCMTGHCAVPYDCQRWKTGCGRCPYPDAHPPIKRDATSVEWMLKNLIYKRSNLTIVTLSNKQTEHAKESMLKHFPIIKIPNGIDTEIFKPSDSEKSRFKLGIPKDKKVLMMSALRLDQHHKGGDLLVKAIQELPKHLKSEIILLLVGLGGEKIASKIGVKTIDLGFIGNDFHRAICYNAADLFIHPTRVDTLPLVLQESMSCGTPMVAFNVGGVPDLVRPNLTGYLAESENSKDLCKGIFQLIIDDDLRNTMKSLCRKTALNEYSLDLQVKKHISLYQKLMQNNGLN